MEEDGILSESQKTRVNVGQIFKYAIATRRAEHNLMHDTAGAYKQSDVKHHPNFSEKELKEFLKTANILS